MQRARTRGPWRIDRACRTQHPRTAHARTAHRAPREHPLACCGFASAAKSSRVARTTELQSIMRLRPRVAVQRACRPDGRLPVVEWLPTSDKHCRARRYSRCTPRRPALVQRRARRAGGARTRTSCMNLLHALCDRLWALIWRPRLVPRTFAAALIVRQVGKDDRSVDQVHEAAAQPAHS